MAREIKRKTTKPKGKAKPAKTRAKQSTASATRKTSAKRRTAVKSAGEVRTNSPPIIGRDVIEEILVHSARSPDGEELSDEALFQIATAAKLDPTKVLEAHARLRDEADEANFATVFQVVELWSPFG